MRSEAFPTLDDGTMALNFVCGSVASCRHCSDRRHHHALQCSVFQRPYWRTFRLKLPGKRKRELWPSPLLVLRLCSASPPLVAEHFGKHSDGDLQHLQYATKISRVSRIVAREQIGATSGIVDQRRVSDHQPGQNYEQRRADLLRLRTSRRTL